MANENDDNDTVEARLARVEERQVHLANVVRALGMRENDMHLVEMVDDAMLHPDGVSDVGNFFGDTDLPTAPPAAGSIGPTIRPAHVPPPRDIPRRHTIRTTPNGAPPAPTAPAAPPPPPPAPTAPTRRRNPRGK